MKKLLFLALVFTVLSKSESFAQVKGGSSYKTAVGVKFYPGAGITLKHFVKSNAALEGIGYFWKDGVRITGLYEFHGNISGAPGLKWYVGPGAHIGFWSNRWRRDYPNYRSSIVGIDGVLGLDYKFKGAPINMSVDWQPSFEFGDYGTYGGFSGNWGGFAIRYTF